MAALALTSGCGTATPSRPLTTAIVLPVPSTTAVPYRTPTATYTSAHAVRHDGLATVEPPTGKPRVSWESVWRSFCPADGSPTKSSQGGTCVSGSTGTVELAMVTLHDTKTPAPKLMYVVTWTKADCESLGGPAGQTQTPVPQPHPCTLRSYVDARTGHDEYDEDAQ
ncbi:hypothetical protein Back2_05720 [Nocardioides baekrokdamisoli]|uniref:Lipoprotein n=1 Tax=Nocardioides baekrokdamisoli TaxID=1804624 RepID=A0A3G9IJP5_9ACTN|nr:hypothetical protein Back2_05720 [Nocardioides baekrokdamisoli]